MPNYIENTDFNNTHNFTVTLCKHTATITAEFNVLLNAHLDI
jgi:hypothetical protein